MRTSNQTRPETLLAAVNTSFADMIILPPAVLAQEERPFQPPLLASAHRQSCSGTSRPGFLPSEGLCSAHSRLASSNRSRMEGFSGVVRSAYSWAFSDSSPRLPLLITPSLIVKVVVSKNIYFLFFQVIRYCSVPDVSINKLSTVIGNHVRHRIRPDYHHFE